MSKQIETSDHFWSKENSDLSDVASKIKDRMVTEECSNGRLPLGVGCTNLGIMETKHVKSRRHGKHKPMMG